MVKDKNYYCLILASNLFLFPIYFKMHVITIINGNEMRMKCIDVICDNNTILIYDNNKRGEQEGKNKINICYSSYFFMLSDDIGINLGC